MPGPEGIANVVNSAHQLMTESATPGADPKAKTQASVNLRLALEWLCELRRSEGDERVYLTMTIIEPDALHLLAAQSVVELDSLGYKVPIAGE